MPFDFLVNGEYLRTSLGAFADSHNLSKVHVLGNWRNSQEEIIQVEFFEAMMPPEPATEIKEDDWVASVAGWLKGSFILSGSYDNNGDTVCVAFNNTSSCVGLFRIRASHTLRARQ